MLCIALDLLKGGSMGKGGELVGRRGAVFRAEEQLHLRIAGPLDATPKLRIDQFYSATFQWDIAVDMDRGRGSGTSLAPQIPSKPC